MRDALRLVKSKGTAHTAMYINRMESKIASGLAPSYSLKWSGFFDMKTGIQISILLGRGADDIGDSLSALSSKLVERTITRVTKFAGTMSMVMMLLVASLVGWTMIAVQSISSAVN